MLSREVTLLELALELLLRSSSCAVEEQQAGQQLERNLRKSEFHPPHRPKPLSVWLNQVFREYWVLVFSDGPGGSRKGQTQSQYERPDQYVLFPNGGHKTRIMWNWRIPKSLWMQWRTEFPWNVSFYLLTNCTIGKCQGSHGELSCGAGLRNQLLCPDPRVGHPLFQTTSSILRFSFPCILYINLCKYNFICFEPSHCREAALCGSKDETWDSLTFLTRVMLGAAPNWDDTNYTCSLLEYYIRWFYIQYDRQGIKLMPSTPWTK